MDELSTKAPLDDAGTSSVAALLDAKVPTPNRSVAETGGRPCLGHFSLYETSSAPEAGPAAPPPGGDGMTFCVVTLHADFLRAELHGASELVREAPDPCHQVERGTSPWGADPSSCNTRGARRMALAGPGRGAPSPCRRGTTRARTDQP